MWPNALPVRTVEREAADVEANGFPEKHHCALKGIPTFMQAALRSPMSLV